MSSASFTVSALDIRDHDIFDLGIVDVNSDGWMDIFTTNHSAEQSLLINQKDNSLKDIFRESGLEQSYGVPGMEDTDILPVTENPGIYIYRYRRWLHIKAHDINPKRQFMISLEVPWPLEYSGSMQALQSESFAAGVTNASISLSNGDTLKIRGKYDIIELPHKFYLDSDIKLEDVFLGVLGTNARDHNFVVEWRDRHGMSWTDLNEDGLLDVFISRGGAKGKLLDIPAQISDELYLQTPDLKFEKADLGEQYRKLTCPSRQTTWTSISDDNNLKLHIVCGRRKPLYPNQLWSFNDGKAQQDIAPKMALDYRSESTGRWLDIDGDSDTDYVAAEGDLVSAYINQRIKFSKSTLVELSNPRIKKIVSADIDNDGDLDLYAGGLNVSTLLINNGSSFEAYLPSTWGLPDTGFAPNWVDFDNNGLMDFHIIPHGLYYQTENGQFIKASVLEYQRDINLLNASQCSWFDMDNNGSVDAVCTFAYHQNIIRRAVEKHILGREDTRYFSTFVATNSEIENNWIAFDMYFSQSNPIAAGTAVLAYDAPMKTPRRFYVGQSEGSQYGQGNYRVHIGLGEKVPKTQFFEVIWPNGVKQSVKDARLNQINRIVYEPTDG